MALLVDFAVKAPVGQVQAVMQEALAAFGMDPKWGSPTTGIGFGGLFTVEFEIFPMPDQTLLRLRRKSVGLAFGGAGVGFVYQRFKMLKEWISAKLSAQGVLLGIRQD